MMFLTNKLVKLLLKLCSQEISCSDIAREAAGAEDSKIKEKRRRKR